MAAEAVAGAFLSSVFQFLFERMDSPEIAAFFKGHKLDLSLVKKLKVAMITVTGLLDHAEEKQIVVPAVKKWLDELKDAAYEADDLLDEIAYEALRSELEAGSTRKKLCRLFSSHNPFDMAVNAKLEKILERLEYLTGQMNALGLTLREGIGDKPSSHKTPTTSLPDDESSICGRKDDRKKITKSLLSDSRGIGVICVVSIGGMGKTTLAQLVYNDKEVDRHFNLKAWVYVSQEFNVFKITTEICSKVSSWDCKANNLSELQQKLKQKLEGKKYLLVLDDVWSDKYAEWESLLKPLKAGAQGSKIVVTTRIERIASAMKNNQMHIDLIHPLEKLSDDDCWSMLATYAFHDENSNSRSKKCGGLALALKTIGSLLRSKRNVEEWEKISQRTRLEAVGKEIAKKCGGLPLALKTIGSLLRSKRNVEEWEKISQSNMWNLLSDNIVPALKLSYHDLPSHLKQCFAYCAVFPKGYEFYKEDLIPLWMAEGFIMEAKEGDDNEDLGDAYFKDLVSRSFFQVSSGSKNCFVMHDHMHDLAKSISGEFCFMLDKNSSDKVPTKTRYLYIRHGDDWFSEFDDAYGRFSDGYYKCIIEKVNESQQLRTFLSDDYFHRNWRVLPALLPKLKQLRVLVLDSYCKRKLPNSIGNLKHLRYLNLRGASIIKLPQSVSSLYNLQTLILRDCEDLVELPANLARLINLCCLDLRGTKLRRMPPQMGNLVKLRTLTNFSLGKGCGSGIMELGKLQHIQGELSIENLQNINPKHVSESKLWNKEQLKTLEFKWRGESKDAKHANETLKQLWPHKKVENLYIVGYDDTIFPYWVGSSSSSLSNLVCLKLSECNNCSCLPPLGQLASLKDLSITGFAKLVSVGFEFYGSCRPPMKPFGSLIILRFERIEQWEEWKSEDGAFPHLEELYVKHCPRLIKALPNNLSCLKKLQVVGCEKQLVFSLRVPPTILEMRLKDDSRDVVLEKLPFGQHRMEVRELKVTEVDSVNSLLEGIEQADGLASTLEEIKLSRCAIERFPLEIFPELKRIDISECSNLKSLTATEEIQEESSFCPNLTELLLKRCSNLKSLPEHIGTNTSLVKLEIENCDRLELFPKGGLPSKLESLAIICCPSLKIKVIHGINNNYEGDEETLLLLPSTLTRLNINGLYELESLNYRGLELLRELIILWCTNLQSIPDCMQSLLPYLVKLEIDGCPKLEPFLEGGLPSQLESLKISGCTAAIAAGLIDGCDKAIARLMKRDFRTRADDEVECIPEETLLPSSLTHLEIWNLKNVQYLELHNLTSLNVLSIGNCPNLRCIAKERLSSSLSSLHIGFGCPLLRQRCEKNVGEYWPYISHIPCIDIDQT